MMRNRGYLSSLILIAYFCLGCASTLPTPIQHSGPPAIGSARWAYSIAKPSIDAFANDVQLYEIIGAQVYRDGRLPTNTGNWSFVTWSASLRQTFQATVKFDGTISTTIRNDNSPPSQNGQPLSQSWADSTTVFAAAAPHVKCGVTLARLAALNIASYAEAPNVSAWGLSFDVGQNQIVKWDGTYIAPQGSPDVPCMENLKSDFLKSDVCANLILSGAPYEINDANWLVNGSDQNREVCAYKFLAAFHMLGYNTDNGGTGQGNPNIAFLQRFQTLHALPASTLVDTNTLKQLDAELVTREAKIAATAATFQLYTHMQPLHQNDISKNWLAYISTLPISVLPATLKMNDYETAQCIWGQCVGDIQDTNGVRLACQQLGCYTADLSGDYRFVGAYFDPKRLNGRLPSASTFVGTVLHEYAHYLDGTIYQPYTGLSHLGIIQTNSFDNISYDMSQYASGCAPRRSNNVQEWISKYGFLAAVGCPPGKATPVEEFAEAFSIYVAAGKVFRAAAQQNAVISQKYNWLKSNVFQGVEYDTDLQREVESGCNDVPGYQQAQPGYASCSVTYIWDAELRIK